MKKSRYNSLHTVRGQEVLYNAFSEKMCIMDPEVARLYTAGDPDAIKEAHPSFHSYLFCASRAFLLTTHLTKLPR